MTTLITGASGFCGCHLAERLRQENWGPIVGLSRRPPSDENLWSRFMSVDVTDPESLQEAVRVTEPDVIFHLAARRSGSTRAIYRTNFEGTRNLLDAVARHRDKCRVLLVGSAAEYGNLSPSSMPLTEKHSCAPRSAYGKSKHDAVRLGQRMARERRVRVVVARPFNVVGAGVPENLVVGAVIKRAREALSPIGRDYIQIGNVDIERDFVAVEDIVEAFLRMVEDGYWGEVFNLCSGVPRRVEEVVQTILSFASRPLRTRIDPELVRSADCPIIYGSWEKARDAFGFRPRTPLADALRAAWEDALSAEARWT